MQRSAVHGISPERPDPRLGGLWAVFAAFSVAACVFAFVDFSRSGFWTDELFTLFVIDHHGGLAEVLRRALTDTHPPAYYFMLYEWSRVWGVSETALRASSAIFAVMAAAVFYAGLRGVFSPTARAFALALSLNGSFWFDQSQNARTYAAGLLIASLLLTFALAARRQVAAGRLPAWPCAGLMLVGLVGSFCHAYIFLEVGLVYVFVAATVASAPLRAALVVWGAGIAALVWRFDQLLLRSTLQDVHHMWFSNDPLFIFNQITVSWRNTFGFTGIAALVVLAASAWRRRREAASPSGAGEGEGGWIAGLGLFAHLGMVGLGLLISLLLAPSMSSQNLAVAGPMLWSLSAWLYDRGGPRDARPASRLLAAALVAATAAHLPILAGRLLVRTEDWRGSARYVASLPACAGKPIPVVPPRRFGPDTPFFRTLAVRSFYGRYFPEPGRLQPHPAAELTGAARPAALSALMAARASGADPCPVLAWAVHDLEPDQDAALREALQRAPGVAPAKVTMRAFDHYPHEEVGYSSQPGAFVYLAGRP